MQSHDQNLAFRNPGAWGEGGTAPTFTLLPSVGAATDQWCVVEANWLLSELEMRVLGSSRFHMGWAVVAKRCDGEACIGNRK